VRLETGWWLLSRHRLLRQVSI